MASGGKLSRISTDETIQSSREFNYPIDTTDTVQYYLKTFDGVENVELGFLKDVLLDVEDLLHPDAHALEMLDTSAYLQYPAGEPLSSSVVSLPNSEVKIVDPFLDILASSYNATKKANRGINSFNEKRRLSFIDRKDRVLVLEFPNELEYWKMIRAISCSLKDFDAVYICKSTWPRRESSSDKDVFSSNAVYNTCQIHNGALTFNSGKDSEIVDLQELKALTVSWDYETVTECILKTSFFLVGNLSKLHASIVLSSSATSHDDNTKALILYDRDSTGIRLKSREVLSKSKLLIEIYPGLPGHEASAHSEPNVSDKFGSLELSLADLQSSVPKVAKIPLSVPLSHRAVRVVVHSAEGLQSTTAGKEPSPYCSVYLLSAHENEAEKVYLTAKTKETKTTSKSGMRNPVWNEEFVLNGPKGLEGASALRIKVKDAGTGFFHSDKNLGQVTIPVACFVAETEATLVLPLEPASKMPSTNSSSPDLGEIRLSTELVAMSNFMNPLLNQDAVHSAIVPHSPKVVNRATIAGIGEAHVYCSLKEPTPYELWWWPCRLSTRSVSTFLSAHILCKYDYCYIKVAPIDVKIFGEIFKSAEIGAASGMMKFPWSNFKSVDHLTESVCFATFECTVDSSNGSLYFGSYEIDVVIAPCPSRGLTLLMKDRIQVYDIRSSLKNFILRATALENESEEDRRSREAEGAWTDDALLSVARGILGLLENERDHFRSKLYFAQLLHGCQYLPERFYTRDVRHISVLVRQDEEKIADAVKHYDENWRTALDDVPIVPAPIIVDRIRIFIECCSQQVRNMILFSSSPPARTPAHTENNIQSTKAIIGQLVLEYSKSISTMLHPFIASKEAFRKINGQDDKTCIVRFLIKENNKMNAILAPVLNMISFRISPPPLLVSNHELDSILDWYTLTIFAETKSWLARTIGNAWGTKQNKFNIPWDVFLTQVDKKYISSIPETYRYQLNCYLELCSKKPEPRFFGDMINTEEVERVLQINDKIVSAVSRSLMLLADEYKLSLQSKHWERGDEDEVNANIYFLVACVNDAHRLSTVHTEPLRGIETGRILIRQLIGEVAASFQGVVDVAITNIVRVVFTDLEKTLYSFDELWEENRQSGSTSGEPVLTITISLTDFIGQLFEILESKYFANVVTLIIDTCLLRYLIFLRDYATKTKGLSKEDLSRFAFDAANLKSCFLCPSIPIEHSFRDLLDRKLKYVTDLVDLITQDWKSDHCNEIVHKIAERYIGEHKTVGCNVLAITSALRTKAFDNAYQVYIGSVLDEAESSSDYCEVDSNDLYLRLFASVERDKAQQDELKSSGGFGRRIREKAADLTLPGFGSAMKQRKSETAKVMELRRELGLGAFENDELSDIRSQSEASTTVSEFFNPEFDLSRVPISNQYVVKVEVVRCKSLHSQSFFGGANPYVALALGNARIKTPVVWGNSDPVWNNFNGELYAIKDKLHQYRLNIKVFDKERIRRKRQLGSLSISLATLNVRPIDAWFALESTDEHSDSQVYLLISILDRTK